MTNAVVVLAAPAKVDHDGLRVELVAGHAPERARDRAVYRARLPPGCAQQVFEAIAPYSGGADLSFTGKEVD